MHQVSVTSFVEFAVNSNGSKEGVLRIKWPGEENNWFLSDSSTCSLNVVQFIADLQPLACYSTGHTTKTHTSRVMTHYVRFLVLKALQASQFTGVDLIHVQVLVDLQLILADAVRWREKKKKKKACAWDSWSTSTVHFAGNKLYSEVRRKYLDSSPVGSTPKCSHTAGQNCSLHDTKSSSRLRRKIRTHFRDRTENSSG